MAALSPESVRQGLAVGLLGLVLAGAVRLASGARLEPADLVFNNGTEVQTLDPASVTGVPEGRVVRALFEGLVVKHPRTLEPLPGMAERWELSEDGRTWTFWIREGAEWTNGDPVRAEDFVYSFRRFLHPSTAAYYAYQLWYVRGARAYTRLPDDLHYAKGANACWISRTESGTLRIGAQEYALAALADDAILELDAETGVLRAGEGELALPGGSLLGALRPGPASGRRADALRGAPYDASGAEGQGSWLAETEAPVNEEAWQELLDSGALLDGPAFRTQVVEPELLGIRSPAPGVLEIELNAPTPFFIDLMGFYPTFPVNRRCLEEAQARWPDRWEIEWVRPENIVTNGPFRIAERRVNDRIRLVKNETYWDADSVALGSIDVLAIEQDSTMLNMYLTGGCDVIDRVNTNVVQELMGREDFQPTAYLGTYFYRVNVTKAPYDDPRVRRALALVIPRREICEQVMKMGQQPCFSLSPPGIGAYVPPTMREGDLEEARRLLTEAGFPGGEGFPPIEIHYNTSEAHASIAQVIALAWQDALGIRTKLRNEEWKVYLDTQFNLRYDVSRSAWIGDYGDPNTFVDLMVTGGENNKTGWGDPEYDRLVAAAALELDAEVRLGLLRQAEALLMEELPILPIYSYVTQNVVAPRLGGFEPNVLDEHFPKFWYWMDDAELAERRAAQPASWRQVAPHGPAEGLYSPAQQRARAEAR
jgi:oligopeptide transport system substrate-binding protein